MDGKRRIMKKNGCIVGRESLLVYSMTGYGRGSSTEHGIGISVEIKTVNHRYMDVFFRLPRELQQWEDAVRKKVTEKLRRGRIEINAALDEVPEEMYQLNVNENMVRAYAHSLERVRDIVDIKDDLSLEHLLRFSEIFSVKSDYAGKKEIWEVLRKALEEALDNLVEQRQNEGLNLKEDLEERCGRMESLVSSMKDASGPVVEHYREKLQQRLSELVDAGWDENRILTECALIAERSNVEEEITRLESHLQSFKETLEMDEAVGRKLDFILQEMLREVNTTGSKAGNYDLSSLVVEAKAELEKMREQVQNIE